MKIITSPNVQMQKHVEERMGITNHFNVLLENLINANQHKRGKYYILGKVKTQRKGDKYIVKPFLQACEEKPGIIRESFVYEVDNTRGVKTLLWVMHPGGMLSFPTLGKSIRVSDDKGATILTPK